MPGVRTKLVRGVRRHDRVLRTVGLLVTWGLLVLFLYASLHSIDQADLAEQREGRDSPANPLLDKALDARPGGKGKPVRLSGPETRLVADTYPLNEFNLVASDKVGFVRSLPDFRNGRCRSRQYPPDLPTLSIVVIFHNEALSTLLRTVTSCLYRTDPALLQQIILVDDLSDREHLKQPLQWHISNFTHLVRVYRTPSRQGLIKARIYGSKFATGDAIVFLDSHCECTEGWAEPILYEIKKDERTAVQPSIGSIDKNNFRFAASGHVGNQGDFRWDLLFHWRPIHPNHQRLRKDYIDAVRTPTMAGGLFGISRAWWNHLGQYDPGFELWGGENLEISIKSWLCGGSVVIVPCSIIGHVFRSKHPYHWYKEGPDRAFSANARRLAEVWLDEYKKVFYKQAGDAIYLADMGNITDRLELKRRLNCKPFKWFLENVVYMRYIPTLDTQLEGSVALVSDPASPQCLDTYSKPSDEIHVYPCHYQNTQKIEWTAENELRIGADVCLEAITVGVHVVMTRCNLGVNQRWRVDQSDRRVTHVATGACLTLLRSAHQGSRDSVVIEGCAQEGSDQRTSQTWRMKKNASD